MKKYIVFIVVFLLGVVLFCGCKKEEQKELSELELIKQQGFIKVGVKSDSIPFGYYKNNELTGFDVEIAQEIAKAIFADNSKNRLKLIPVNAQNRISKLNSKEVDILIATMSVNEKRKLVVDFSMPYFVANQKIMVRKGSKITHLNHFNSKGKLAVVMGTTGEKISHLIAPNANVIGAKSYNQASSMLKNYKVDAILGDDCILKGLNSNNQFKIINRAYSREYYAVALRKSEKSKDLLNVVNATIAKIIDEKRINIIKSHYNI